MRETWGWYAGTWGHPSGQPNASSLRGDRAPAAFPSNHLAVPTLSPMTPEGFGALATAIADELHRLDWWPDGVAEDAPAIDVSGPFGQPDLPFAHWLALVLVPRLREVARGQADPPGQSMVGAQAVREFDGVPEADAIVRLLSDLDALVEGR